MNYSKGIPEVCPALFWGEAGLIWGVNDAFDQVGPDGDTGCTADVLSQDEALIEPPFAHSGRMKRYGNDDVEGLKGQAAGVDEFREFSAQKASYSEIAAVFVGVQEMTERIIVLQGAPDLVEHGRVISASGADVMLLGRQGHGTVQAVGRMVGADQIAAGRTQPFGRL